jgi:hypothetical protein
MKTTSNHHGYQVKIHTTSEDYQTDPGEYLWNKGKIYKTRPTALKVIGNIGCALDAGKLNIPGYRHCEIIEWFG